MPLKPILNGESHECFKRRTNKIQSNSKVSNICVNFEKYILNKIEQTIQNKDELNKLWDTYAYQLLFEENDTKVYKKFLLKLQFIKEVYFKNTPPSCNESDRIEDFDEWYKDKDVENILVYMKSLEEQIKLKFEIEQNLNDELKETERIKKVYFKHLNAE